MKCSNCGCEEFYTGDLNHRTGCDLNGKLVIQVYKIDAYICKKCGKIELYSTDFVNKKIKIEEEKKAKEEEERKKKEKLQALLDKKNELINFINDENNTVKAVNEAKAELEKIEYEIEIETGERTKDGSKRVRFTN